MPFKTKNNREAVVVCAIHVVKRPSKRSVLVLTNLILNANLYYDYSSKCPPKLLSPWLHQPCYMTNYLPFLYSGLIQGKRVIIITISFVILLIEQSYPAISTYY